MRRTPGNGGALSFRAWAHGSVVYEARVYAGDVAVSGGEEKGMWVEDTFLHVLAASSVGDAGDKGEGERGGAADAEHLLIGGIEVWGEHLARKAEEGGLEPEPTLRGAQGSKDTREELVVQDDVMPRSTIAGKLRFVFVARYMRSTESARTSKNCLESVPWMKYCTSICIVVLPPIQLCLCAPGNTCCLAQKR